MKFFPIQVIRIWIHLMTARYDKTASVNPTVKRRRNHLFKLLNGQNSAELDYDQGQPWLERYSPVAIPIEDGDYGDDYDLDS